MIPLKTTYTKKELLEVLGKNSSYLALLKKQGLLFFIERNGRSDKVFTSMDIELIFLIRYLRFIHMPTYEIRRFLELTLFGDETLVERRQMLADLDHDLKRKEQRIRRTRKYCGLLRSSLLKNNGFAIYEFWDYLNIDFTDSDWM